MTKLQPKLTAAQKLARDQIRDDILYGRGIHPHVGYTPEELEQAVDNVVRTGRTRPRSSKAPTPVPPRTRSSRHRRGGKVVRAVRATRAAYRALRDLPVTTAQARVGRATRISGRRSAVEAGRQARAAHRAAKVRDKVAKRPGVTLGNAEVHRVRPFGGMVPRRASEEFGNGVPRNGGQPATVTEPKVILPPRKPAKPASSKPAAPPATPPGAPTSPVSISTRRMLMTSHVGTLTRAGAAADRQYLAELGRAGVEDLVAALKTYGRAVELSFGPDLAEGTLAMFGHAGRQHVNTPELAKPVVERFNATCADAAKSLHVAYRYLSTELAKQHDLVVRTLASEYDRNTLAAAARSAR